MVYLGLRIKKKPNGLLTVSMHMGNKDMFKNWS